ncbi:unnamed protein product [Mesocestoides corti]|uniref:SCP domain-containing protein n=1 Tax=Mesocestoides corti TaxID=53468 RepID=A0A0R3UKQ2_MESCO|nr:unnamed protein product [Mesocestoides corti]
MKFATRNVETTSSYSSELEKLADAWVANCKIAFPDVTKQPEYKGLGHIITGGLPENGKYVTIVLARESLQTEAAQQAL